MKLSAKNIPDAPRVAAFFDLDNTLVNGSTLYYFLKGIYSRGGISLKNIVLPACEHIRFKLAGENLGIINRIKQEGLNLGVGLRYSWLQEIAYEIYEEHISKNFWPGALKTLVKHQKNHHDVWIITAAPQFIADIIVERLHLTGAVGTVIEVVEGKITGKISSVLMHGEQKNSAVRALAQGKGYDLDECYAYGDSINDVPLLSAAGHPYAINPDKKLRAYALSHDWPIKEHKS